MTDHNSPAGAVGGGQPAGPPASFGHPPEQPGPQQAGPQQPGPQAAPPGQQYAQQSPAYQQQQAQHPQQQQHPQQPPQQMPSDAARAQVAAAWVRSAPQVGMPTGQAAVPTLPPRNSRSAGDSKREKRDQAKAERKAEYERKKAAREARKQGGGTAAGASGSTTPRTAPIGQTPLAAPASQHPATPPQQHQQHSAASPTTPTTPANSATTAPPSRPTSRGAAFDVPQPGRRIPAGGRRTHVALRATLLITTCVFALGSCGVMGLLAGKSSSPQAADLDAKEAAKYRLTDFPMQAAATFAEHYALLCMTYAPNTIDDRQKDLARFASAGVDADCGWDGQGTQKAVSANWDGTVEKLPEYGAHGRYLGIQVRLDNGALTTLTVPVYVQGLADGEGLRVAGDVGEMPLPSHGTVPGLDEDDQVTDDALSAQLQKKVLPGYFEAWGQSDATAMTRFTTPDATQAATAGLRASLSDPTINEVVALAPKGFEDSESYTYKADQPVQALVALSWTGPNGTAVRRSYRVTVVNTEQGWFIRDIHGGVLDAEGGSADEGEAAPPTEEATTGSDSGAGTGDDGGGTGGKKTKPSAKQSPSGKHRKS
ncbi:conjugal transfer protein [Streptomyces sp. H27-D2]|uniref:conjugal transfer protein n=1 Tax=Streptomyces sp. H27-D2 TaxID=3046304 RepID=UPI002DBD7EB5|nr:conjugal transfer protein [Streptomyces sp. H27-D2]MEC4018251.1 conjugal transfer protein [Streptomyces sp. H27-D2]